MPSSRARAATGVGVGMRCRPDGRSGTVTTPTSDTSGCAEEGVEDRDGEGPRPEEDGRDRPGHASAVVARCSASSSSLSPPIEMSSSIDSR